MAALRGSQGRNMTGPFCRPRNPGALSVPYMMALSLIAILEAACDADERVPQRALHPQGCYIPQLAPSPLLHPLQAKAAPTLLAAKLGDQTGNTQRGVILEMWHFHLLIFASK